MILAPVPPPRRCISSTRAYTCCRTVHGLRTASASASTPRVTIRGDKLGMSSKAALAPSQLESHITHLMRASFSQLKVHPHLPSIQDALKAGIAIVRQASPRSQQPPSASSSCTLTGFRQCADRHQPADRAGSRPQCTASSRQALICMEAAPARPCSSRSCSHWRCSSAEARARVAQCWSLPGLCSLSLSLHSQLQLRAAHGALL